ncbi:hypothetical protein HZC09_07040 [Candidatus Micrarchaeota archaeon]|nr:hypothetical protein [Candidatus Micrarchaeota archaeon]
MIMKQNKKTILTSLFILLMLPALVGAFTITSVTTSSTATRATTGSDVTVTATLVGDSSGTATQVQITGTGRTTGSSVTVSDPAVGYYSGTSVSTSGSSVTFVVSAGTADVYDYTVQATYQGGSASSTSTVLEFVDPSAVIVLGSIANTSVWPGRNVSVSSTLSNPSAAENVTTTYALGYSSSYFSVLAGDATTSTLTLQPSQTYALGWTINATNSVSASPITITLGDTTAFSQNVDVNAFSSANATPTPVPAYLSGTTPVPSVTPVPTVAPTAAPAALPPIPEVVVEKTAAGEEILEKKTERLGTAAQVTGHFAENSATFMLSYVASSGGFVGEVSYKLPFDYADYQAGKITLDPAPIKVEPGSIIATWDVELAPAEVFTAKVEVAEKVEETVLQQFETPKAKPAPKAPPSEITPAPAEAPAATPAPAPAKAAADNTLLYIGIGVIILAALYFLVFAKKK